MTKKDYFKWLIDDAIYLCKDIDSVTNDIIHARLNNDEEGNNKAIFRMEKIMIDTLQFLSCIIERKDNIVDLGEVWHTLDLKSKPDVDIAYLDIVATVDNEILREVTTLNSLYNWLRYNSVVQGQVKWAFWRNLLPKGGN